MHVKCAEQAGGGGGGGGDGSGGAGAGRAGVEHAGDGAHAAGSGLPFPSRACTNSSVAVSWGYLLCVFLGMLQLVQLFMQQPFHRGGDIHCQLSPDPAFSQSSARAGNGSNDNDTVMLQLHPTHPRFS